MSYDPSTALTDGIKTVLSGNVTVGSVTYPVYDTVEWGPTNRTYVYIGPYIDTEQGTKDDFVFTGSITVESVDEGQVQNVKRSTVRAVNNKVRDLLKSTKAGVFTITGRTLVVFRHGGSNEIRETHKDGRTRLRIIDIYEFVIN
jgi:hypothetical protein